MNTKERPARALWKPEPDLPTAAEAWILAGGAHHTGFSLAVGCETLEDFTIMAGIECLVIDRNSVMRDFRVRLNC